MRRASILFFLFFPGISLLFWASPLFPHALPGEKKAQSTDIEGLWTQVSWENQGKVVSFLPEPLRALGTGPSGNFPFLWKISKDEIKMGSHLYAYELHPGNKAGTMDLIPLDKDGKKLLKQKGLVIYFLADDWLFIYSGAEIRPETFTTSEKHPTWNLVILRRGKLK